MAANPGYSTGKEQPYPTQQPMAQYPPSQFGGYPPPSNQNAYPPPVETVPALNPAFPPPPAYDAAVGKPAGAVPSPYGPNYSYGPQYQSQPTPPSYTTSSDVEYQGAAFHDRIISFDDKTIRLGRLFSCRLSWSIVFTSYWIFRSYGFFFWLFRYHTAVYLIGFHAE